MKRRRSLTWLLCAALSCLLAVRAAHSTIVPLQQASLDTWNAYAFKIEDSKCRVGIASVQLSVSELSPIDGNLVATYSIHVPLRQSSNDSGRIVLPIKQTVEQLNKSGGTLTGTAYSNKEGATPNKIICEICPQEDKGIRLAIITDKRTLKFKSRYTVIDNREGS